MLEDFLRWAKERQSIERDKFSLTLTVSQPTSNPSARLDVDGPHSIARLTVWNSGDIDMEVLEIRSGKSIYTNQLFATAPCDFDVLFAAFFTAIS